MPPIQLAVIRSKFRCLPNQWISAACLSGLLNLANRSFHLHACLARKIIDKGGGRERGGGGREEELKTALLVRLMGLH